MSKQNLTLSVVMITYGHQDYIQKAIEGVLMQKSDYAIELIIADDCSPDNTFAIVKEIIETHPRGHLIKYTKHKTNLGMMSNFIWSLEQCKGKYIALCEGDDYWTDPLKLQKQVDFLEENEEYGMVHTDHDYKDEVTNQVIKNYWFNSNRKHFEEENYVPLLTTGDYRITTGTVLVRADLILKIIKTHSDDFSSKNMMGDIQMWFHLARYGKIKYFNFSTMTYRRHAGGVTSMYDFNKRYLFIKNVYRTKRSLLTKYGYEEVKPSLDKIFLFSLGILSAKINKRDDSKHFLKQYKALKSTSSLDVLKFQITIFLVQHPKFARILSTIKRQIKK